MANTEHNIFIGYQDLCSTIGEMEKAFRKLGYKVFSAVHMQNRLYDKSKISFRIDQKISEYYKSLIFKIRYRLFNETANDRVKEKLLNKIIKENDIFIIYHPSLFPDHKDLIKIKNAGKKLVCLVFGDDVRWYNAMCQWHDKRSIPRMEYENDYINSLNIDKWIGYLRFVEKYSDVVIMHPDTAHMALRPYSHYYMQLDCSVFLPGLKQRKTRPVVAHAPSDKKIKGTSYILKAVQELKDEGLDFEFRLMEKVPYDKVYDFYKDIDVMVVQLLAHGGGKQSYELLSCGKVVISRMQYEDYLPHIKKECPIIDADINNIKEVLRKTVLDFELRQELASKARSYVLKYHDVNAFCDRILHLLNNKNEFDYKPSFFREEYMPINGELSDLNKWNRFVSDCDWYIENVPKGERAGLVF